MDDKVTIRIKDTEYVIRGSDDRKQILKAAEYVDTKLREIEKFKRNYLKTRRLF